MSITINLYYIGRDGQAQQFVQAMEESGIADAIRQEPGNERYEYFQPLDRPDTVLLIDQWSDQQALDAHHASAMMEQLAQLRERFDLHMQVQRFTELPDETADAQFIRS
ncbi:putative quinol monooxygenase [Bifidobacterium gallicum]|nr:putative quinol monooxygenase [Bifidobacterium gallicum]KFI59507.1 antibiotic biosynthesis monooxygenase family protein [Bifidobacterium gallicum DSM 20093 = LMG 11596]